MNGTGSDHPPVVQIVEVGPRDGLQNETWVLPPGQRVGLIDALSASGLKAIEVGSFVSPRRVPQMAGSDTVLRGIARVPGGRYPVLVPNVTGMTKAIEAGAEEIALFLSASESFSQRNTNCSIATSLERASAVMDLARAHHIRVRGYVSCVMGCPYEGRVPLRAVVELSERLLSLGCDEISLGDTIGVGTPHAARDMVRSVAASVSIDRVAIHFHDTFGQALANVLACLEVGVTIIDSATGGLGGCPYAEGASGNLATEDLLYMLDGLGVQSGVDLGKLLDAVDLIETLLGIPARSKLAAARRRRLPALPEHLASRAAVTPVKKAALPGLINLDRIDPR